MPYFDTMIWLQRTDYIKPDCAAANLLHLVPFYCTAQSCIALNLVSQIRLMMLIIILHSCLPLWNSELMMIIIIWWSKEMCWNAGGILSVSVDDDGYVHDVHVHDDDDDDDDDKMMCVGRLAGGILTNAHKPLSRCTNSIICSISSSSSSSLPSAMSSSSSLSSSAAAGTSADMWKLSCWVWLWWLHQQ